MSIFDKLFNKAQNAASDAVKTAVSNMANKKEEFTFAKLPESLAELQALPEAKLDDPYKTAALTVVALCVYAADKNIGIEMQILSFVGILWIWNKQMGLCGLHYQQISAF